MHPQDKKNNFSLLLIVSIVCLCFYLAVEFVPLVKETKSDNDFEIEKIRYELITNGREQAKKQNIDCQFDIKVMFGFNEAFISCIDGLSKYQTEYTYTLGGKLEETYDSKIKRECEPYKDSKVADLPVKCLDYYGLKK